MPVLRHCPNCDSTDVHILQEQDLSFDYGIGDTVLTLHAVGPVNVCRSCGTMTLSHLAEIARHMAVVNYWTLLADNPLSFEELTTKYKNKEHPVYTRRKWCTAIAECHTMEPDYWVWVYDIMHQDWVMVYGV